MFDDKKKITRVEFSDEIVVAHIGCIEDEVALQNFGQQTSQFGQSHAERIRHTKGSDIRSETWSLDSNGEKRETALGGCKNTDKPMSTRSV